MSRKIKGVIALLLVILMTVPMLISCGKSGGNGGSGGDDTGKPNDNDREFLDDLPDDLDFEGKTFHLLAREDNMYENYAHEVIADDNEVELVNQAVYERNTAIEERFGVTIDVDLKPGSWAQKDDFINFFKTSIMAGDGAYDLIMGYEGYMADITHNDLYLNLYDVPYLDFEKDHWYHDIVDELTVDGKLFFAVGDYSLTFWEYIYVLYFNKTIANNYNVEDIYALVKDGSWTIDKLIEIAKGKYKDLNGDNWPGSEDQYGYISCYQNTLDALFSQFDVQATHRNESNEIVLDVDQSKVVSILEKMNGFFATDDVYTYDTTSSTTIDDNPLDKMFREDKALFYPERINRAQIFRDMETDFGIVPYPKWNEQQKEYSTQAWNSYSVAVVPMDVSDREFTGAMLEALTAESSRTVIPAYNEQALTYKYTRDDESAEMLELIRKNVSINFGYFYYDDLRTGEWFRILISKTNPNNNFVSYYAANKSGYERSMKKILKSYTEHE